MKYSASEKLEIIRLVERAHLPAKQALGTSRTTFYRWYAHYHYDGEAALQASGCDQVNVVHKPRLLSDNGSSYISNEVADWITDNQMSHVRDAPYHPLTQGKIKRWHQTLKNRILLTIAKRRLRYQRYAA